MKLKRILALALALVLVMSLFPAQALATEPTEDPTTPATTAPTEEPTVPTAAEPPVPGTTEAPVPQTTEEAVPQTTEEPAPSEGGLLDGIADFLTGGDKKEENPDVTTGETTSPTELDDTLNIEIDPIPQELNTAQLYEAMFQQKTIRDLFNVINENVDALVGVTDEEGNYLPDMPGFTIGQVYEMDDLLQELKTTSIMDQDELEALEQMNDNVATMIEMLGYADCTCRKITDHDSECPLTGVILERQSPRHIAFTDTAAPANTGVKSSKELVSDEDGNMALKLEAWTEGSTAVVPTEIVFVVDQSGSMFQAADGPNSYMRYSKFISATGGDKKMGAMHPGYYMVITENINYGHTSTDWNGADSKNHKYANAIVKYDETTKEWMRSYQTVAYSYTELMINPTFRNYSTLPYAVLKGQNYNDSTKAKYFKSLYGASLDAYYSLIDEVKTIPNVKIAIVGFSSPKGCGEGWNADKSSNYGGTGIFKNGVFTHASKLTTNDYKNAWHTTGSEAELNQVSASMQKIFSNYNETCTEDGFLLANKIFENSEDQNANRVVVFFTDGFPTCVSSDTPGKGFSGIAAGYDAAIAAANDTKNKYKASVYTFGPSSFGEYPEAREFLQYLSSNYQNAESMGNAGTATSTGHFGVAGNSSDLETMFKELGQTIFNKSQALNEKAEVRDTVTQYFDIGGEYGGGDISLWKVPNERLSNNTIGFNEGKKTQLTAEKDNVTWTTKDVTYTNDDIQKVREGKQVIVTGFDYIANSVDTLNGGGAKLQIMIPIKPKSGFMGGNTVLTNSKDCGVYDENGINLGTFEIQNTDVSFTPSVEVGNAYNYYGSAFLQNLDLSHLNDILDAKVNNQPLDFTEFGENYGLEDWQTDYVSLDVQLYMDKNGDGIVDTNSDAEKVDKLECRGQDIKFAIKLTVTPKVGGSWTPITKVSEGTLKLFYPTLTFHDGLFFYGESIPTGNTAVDLNHGPYWDLGTPIVWTAGDGKQPDDENILILGGEPELYMTYTPRKTGTFGKQDVPVDVNIYADPDKALDITEHCTLAHKPCDDVNWPDCTPISTHSGNSDGYEFWFHVKTCELTITKSSGDSLEPYVFDVYRNGQYYTQVSVLGDNSTTIYELPIGTYTIQENEAWSWRYTPSYTNNEVFLGRDGDRIGFEADEIICTNGLDTHQWLNGYSTVVKNVFGEEH